ncbi:MAG: (2Fe-2S) ferredoxin domain-containing protein [Anaerolineae bacterium]|nr:(2Fe-2S) ferredoxin domain-containing protein [Anaerolineae bacterium]MCB0253042.1 (2Fe-2S) ferredoxin domain-containing protein [Anaerolineae bacterium]
MGQFRKHVFVCTYGPYCCFDGDTEGLLKRLKQRVAEAGLRDEVRINRAGCLNQCGHGPNVVVYPDDVWYCGVQIEDADELFEEHLLNDRPVQRLLFPLPPGNNKDTGGYPAAVTEYKQIEKQLDRLRAAERARIQASLQAPPSSEDSD